jgi:hypothetical protein
MSCKRTTFRLNNKRYQKRLSDKHHSVRFRSKRSQVTMCTTGEAAEEGIFDFTFDSTFE